MNILKKLAHHVAYNFMDGVSDGVKTVLPKDKNKRDNMSDTESEVRMYAGFALGQILAPMNILSPTRLMESLSMDENEWKEKYKKFD